MDLDMGLKQGQIFAKSSGKDGDASIHKTLRKVLDAEAGALGPEAETAARPAIADACEALAVS